MADAEVRVAIVGDNSSLQSALDQSQSKLGSFGRAVGKIALAAGVAAAGGLALLGKASIDAAAQAQQSIGATETVYGKYADSVIRNSKRAATQLGLSADEYRTNANVLGALLANQGVAQDKLAGKTRSLIKTGADLAATYGGETSTAVEALASAFKGEFDPLEQYGISIKQSAVNTEAMRVAGVKTTSAFNDLSAAQQNAAKQQATNNLITKQSAKAQGQFARETDTLAHQQQVLNAHWEDTKAQLGTALLPVVTSFVQMLNDDVVPVVNRLGRQYLPVLQAKLSSLFSGDESGKAQAFGDALSGVDWGSISTSAGELADTLVELGPALADIGVDTVNDGLQVFGVAVGFAADHVDTLRKLLPILAAGFVVLKTAQLANSIAGRDSVIGLIAQWTATRRLIIAQRELAVAMREVAIAQGGQVGAFTTVGGAAAGATSKISALGTAARGAAGIGGLALLTAGLTTTNDTLGTTATVAGAAATGLSVGGPWGAAIGGAIGLAYEFWHANDDLNASLANLDTAKATGDLNAYAAAIEKAQGELDKMQVGAHNGFLTGALTSVGLGSLPELPALFDKITGKTGEAADAVADAKTELDGLRDGSLQLFNPVRDLATAIGDVVQNAIDEADAMREATDAMREKRREATRGLDAELDYRQSIDDANRSLRENGKTVNKSTEAGRANRRSLYDLADAWNRQSDATKNASGSAKAARQNFVNTAQAMGMSADAAKRLADRLFEIPPKRTARIALDGIDVALRNAKTLKEYIAALNNKDIYVTTHYQTIGNKPKAPTPGGGAPRIASPAEQQRQTDKMQLYGETLGRTLAKGAAKGAGKGSGELVKSLFGNVAKGAQLTADEIRKGLSAATDYVRKTVSARIKDDKQAAKRSKAILDDLAKRYRLLKQNAAAQEANNAALAKAVENAQKLHDYANAVRDTFVSFGDITQLGRLDNGRVSLTRLLSELRKRRDDAAEFRRLVAQLAKQGLSRTAIEQLTAQGPEQALATVRAIVSGGQTAVTQISELERQIAASGGALGTTLADKFEVGGKGLGTAAADALVAQLKDRQTSLNATAENMAKALARALRRELADVGQQGGGKQGKQPQQPPKDDGKRTVTVKLTAQQLSAIERGRAVQMDLDAYRSAGGRARR